MSTVTQFVVICYGSLQKLTHVFSLFRKTEQNKTLQSRLSPKEFKGICLKSQNQSIGLALGVLPVPLPPPHFLGEQIHSAVFCFLFQLPETLIC